MDKAAKRAANSKQLIRRRTMKVAITILLLPLLSLLVGCSSKFDECVEKEKESYRTRNNGASYGQVQSKQAEFEMMCSSLKGK